MKKILSIILIISIEVTSFVYADECDMTLESTTTVVVDKEEMLDILSVENEIENSEADTTELESDNEEIEIDEEIETDSDDVEAENDELVEAESDELIELESDETNASIADIDIEINESQMEKSETNTTERSESEVNIVAAENDEDNNLLDADIATDSIIANDSFFGTVDETDLDRAKWECIQDIKDISYLEFAKDDSITMIENFANWINECQAYLDSEDVYNVDGFLRNTKIREFFMYEYNGELIKKTAVRMTKELLSTLKDETNIDDCIHLTDESSQYKTDIYTLYTEGNNAYMANWRDENSEKQDDDFKNSLRERGFALNEIDGSSNVITPSRTIEVYDYSAGGMVEVESNAISIHISKDDFANIVETGTFTIDSSIAKVKFLSQSLHNIINSDKFNPTSNYNGAESLYINISILTSDYVDGNEELNENQSRLVRALNKNVVDLVVKNARGEKINLQGGEIEVSIPYELDDGDEEDVTIWYVNADGRLEYHTATYESGYVTFTTTHFSPYFQYKGVRKRTIWDE